MADLKTGESKWILRSKTTWSAIVAALPSILIAGKSLGVWDFALDGETIAALDHNVGSIITGIGGLLVAWSRFVAKQPVHLIPKKKEATNV